MTKHDGSFQKIEERDDDAIGPAALLVCGFAPDVAAPLQVLLEKVGATRHRIIFCTKDMVKQPLGLALETLDPGEPAAHDELPRAMVLSGFTSARLQGFLKSFGSTNLPRPIFASTTQANLNFPVGKLIMELLKEQRAMGRRR